MAGGARRTHTQPVVALQISPTIIQGSSYIDNPMRRLLPPRTRRRVVAGFDGPNLSSHAVWRPFLRQHKSDFNVLKIIFRPLTKLIDITNFEDRHNVSVPLFQYKTLFGLCANPQDRRKPQHPHQEIILETVVRMLPPPLILTSMIQMFDFQPALLQRMQGWPSY